MRRRVFLGFVCAAALAAGILTETGRAATPLFEDGERVGFIGDSITHGDANESDYHEFVHLYYLTRFPDREITVFDRGISGDTAQGTVRRFDGDIAPCNPTVCTVMLGMNDVGRSLYGSSTTCAPEVQAKRDAKLHLYGEQMDKLCKQIAGIGSRIVLFTPSPFDQISLSRGPDHLEPARPRVNDGLLKCADHCRTLAERFDAALVDMNTGVLRVLEEQHRVDPTFSFYDTRRVHPDTRGHFVMAYLFLTAQGAPAVVSSVKIDAAGRTVVEQTNCTVTELTTGDTSVQFTVKANALPFPTDEVGPLGVRLVPFTDELNREALCVTGLQSGAYALKIDEEEVGHYEARDLADGINLAKNRETPQYQQAVHVATVNRKRGDLSCRLRGMALIELKSLRHFEGDRTDMAQMTAFLDKQLAAMEGKPWHGFYKKQFADYIEGKPHEAEIRAEMAALAKDLYRVNQPVPHRYETTRVGDMLPLPDTAVTEEAVGLTFHLPFDRSLAAATGEPVCTPVKPIEVTYETGPVGEAVVISGDAGLTYTEPDSFPLGKGSIAFWIKPHWSPGEKGNLPVVFRKNDPERIKRGGRMREVNHIEIGFRSAKEGVNLTFFSSANPAGTDGTPRPVFASQALWTVDDWDKGEWLHVCVTVGEWGRRNQTRMYVQGEVVYVWRWHAFPEAHGEAFTLGGDKRTMGLDDFRAYNRILNPDEVYELYRMGARRAELLSQQADGRGPRPAVHREHGVEP
ncbi:MAG: hypothetical protein HN742_20450 [Lentisphaerae bacterium]|jgi:lysophospholipase L1-like esterase|nr:hypothetical protein [Lentisphaerota bacterium]MBT7061365.1 hypothetical protein [Lentisphaerota bacterium]MBT7844262.1 hypothetical protein [Lentisphaerota bacterium]